MAAFPVPADLRRAATAEGRTGWLERLPDVVAELAARWGLEVGAPFEPGGQTAWVAPVRDRDGRDLVLKAGWPHTEARHEADGLRVWDGRGTVRLHAAAELPEVAAILEERCRPGTSLRSRPEPEQDVVVVGLLRRLWVPAPPGSPFRPLQEMADLWAGELEADLDAGRVPLDPGLARAAVALWRELPAGGRESVLLCTDLHAGNILAAGREPWLVVDPKPYVGDPTYDPLQHLLNCEGRLAADPGGLADRLAGMADLDAGRLRLWLFARCAKEAPDWPGLAEVATRLAPA